MHLFGVSTVLVISAGIWYILPHEFAHWDYYVCFLRGEVSRNSICPASGWKSRLFTTVTLFFFVAAFVVFVVLLILANIFNTDRQTVDSVLRSLPLRHALILALWTSSATTAVAVLFAVPAGYALSRFRFPGRIIIDTLIDLPIVLPPVAAALTVLFFISQNPLIRWVPDVLGKDFLFWPEIVIFCQFIAAGSFAIRSSRTAFDEVELRAEHVAMTLGCSRLGSFRRIALPLARKGIISGVILTWARSFGLFGPLIIFADSFTKMSGEFEKAIVYSQSSGLPERIFAIISVLAAAAFLSLFAIRLAGGTGGARA